MHDRPTLTLHFLYLFPYKNPIEMYSWIEIYAFWRTATLSWRLSLHYIGMHYFCHSVLYLYKYSSKLFRNHYLEFDMLAYCSHIVILGTKLVNKLTCVRWLNGSKLACAACYIGPEGMLHNGNLCRSVCCMGLTGYLRYWWEFLIYSTSNAMHWQV